MRERKISLRVLRRLLLNSLSEKVSWCDIVETRRLKMPLSHGWDLFACSLGPASGKTGELIRAKFLQVKGLNEYIDCGLILMNEVQNQCSLGSPTNCYRDDVFCAAWEDGAKENFISRFNVTFKKGDVIVNCCTKGNMKGRELRRLVQQSIPTDNDKVLRRTHPSSWYSEKNRNSQWKAT
jgi:hypothetical protein